MMSDSVTRREFLGTAAAGAALLATQLKARPLIAGEEEGWPPLEPVKIYKVYGSLHYRPIAGEPRAKFEKYLADLEKRLGNVKFVGGEEIRSVKEGAEIAAKLGDAEAVLALGLGQGALTPLAPILAMGRPAVVFNEPWSGLQYALFQQFTREVNPNMLVLSTSDYRELDRTVALLRVPGLLRRTRLLLVGPPDGTPPSCDPEQVKARLGVEVVPMTGEQVREAYDAADPKAAEGEAEQYWLKPAKKVDAPRIDVVRAARMYLALKDIMVRERAQAITINCLSALSRQMMDAQGYPCLAFSKLDDLGLVTGCQADMDNTLTKLMVQYAFGLPGFLANAYFDLGKNVILYDHCTSATMMDGPGGDRAPFTVTTHHTETGAVPDVKMRTGQPITVAKLVELDKMLVSSGRITGIPEGICRTTIAVAVPDLQKMYDNWVSPVKGEWVKKGNLVETVHRIVFYGDHVRSLHDLSTLMGLRVVEEG